MPENEKGPSVGQKSHEGVTDWPPPRIKAAQAQVTGAIWTTLGGVIAFLLGCLVSGLSALTWVGLVLLLIAIVLMWKARQNLVAYSHEGATDWPPPP